MKTIAQQLNIKTFPFEIKNTDGNVIYFETSDGYWEKREYDAASNMIYREYSDGYWEKREYDASGNLIYREYSDGTWEKREYDAAGNEIYCEWSDGTWVKQECADGHRIYFEDSGGLIMDNRPKTDIQKAIDLLTAKGLILDGQILKTKIQ